jgi:ABC-type antimicrobial peptide transport system permease subunit
VENFQPHFLRVSPGFLETMRIRLLAGRDFEWRDVSPDGTSVVIVNESFARRYFPGEPVVGKRFFSEGAAQEIVGLAQDAKYRTIWQAAPPTIYSPRGLGRYVAIQVRTELARPALDALLRDELARAHPALRMIDLTSQSALIGNTLVKERVLALLAGFFSIVAIVLVAVGLYGILNYGVLQRTREIGIRLALGAQRRSVVGLIAADLSVVMMIGLALGVAGGYGASRAITALLYGVTPSDALSIVPPLACVLVVCALSAVVPALRATRVNPVTALRND